MNKKDFIREACIKANPSILELEFGCELIWYYEHQIGGVRSKGGVCRFEKGKRGKVVYQSANPSDEIRVQFKYNKLSSLVKKDDCKIIGRDIRLADVLFAIEKNKNSSDIQTGTDWFIGTDGQIVEFGRWGRQYPMWNLLKDNLNDQSDETIDFLANLLGYGKE